MIYLPRPLSLPTGFVAEKLTTNNFSDSDISYLYNIFTCCFADKYYKFVKSLKRGVALSNCQCNDMADIKYLKMGLRILKTWYNPGNMIIIPAVQPASLVFTVGGTQPNTMAIWDYYTGKTIGCANWAGTLNATMTLLVSSINTNTNEGTLFGALPPFSNTIGFTASYNTGTGAFTLIPPPNIGASLNGINSGMFQSSGNITISPNFIQTWSGGVTGVTLPYNNCIPLTTIQKIVSNMESICGCFNCQNTATIIADNNYVPIGQLFVKPMPPVQTPNQ
jgi:hypothetical protein